MSVLVVDVGTSGVRAAVVRDDASVQHSHHVEVLPDSPAAVAGLKPGDVLTTLGHRWTTSVADVFAAAGDARPGVAVPAVVIRDGKEQTFNVLPADGF